MKRRNFGKSVAHLAALSTLAVNVGSVSAAELYNVAGTKVDFNVEVGFAAFHVSEDYTPANRDKVVWQEGYVVAGFTFEHALSADWKAFGGISGIINGNRGDGDPAGFETGIEGGGQLHAAYGGLSWQASGQGGPSVKVSAGRQKYTLGDGFLIAGDLYTTGVGLGPAYNEGGSIYLGPRNVFAETLIASVDTGTPIKLEGFYLKSEKAAVGERAMAGVNVDYVDEKWGTIGGTYIRGLGVDDPVHILAPLTAASEGMNLFSIHGSSSLGVKNFESKFNYVNEQNSSPHHGAAALDAWAWYAEASYKFSDALWAPKFSYRFASFSGDDPSTSKNEGYDPLSYGFLSYNSWFIGEIAGNYSGPFNSNADVHSIMINTEPNIDVGIGKWTGLSSYVNFYSLREPRSFNGATSKDFGTELAVYAEFQLFENLYLSPAYSVLFPAAGYKQAYGKDEIVNNFQLISVLTY